MPNLLTKELRREIITEQKLDIPYDSTGFVKCLIESHNLSESAASKQVELIRYADVEFWTPGDPELFRLISKCRSEAEKTSSESIRHLFNDFVVQAIVVNIEAFEEMLDETDKESKSQLRNIINAYSAYLAFIKCSMDYTSSEDDGNDEHEYTFQNADIRFAPVPLDKEFKKYLDESRFPVRTRDKMLSNLRKLNSLVINNGRGDSDWLQQLVDRASNGVIIRSSRLTAQSLFHNALRHIEDYNIAEDTLRGGYTSLNHYINFLMSAQKSGMLQEIVNQSHNIL